MYTRFQLVPVRSASFLHHCWAYFGWHKRENVCSNSPLISMFPVPPWIVSGSIFSGDVNKWQRKCLIGRLENRYKLLLTHPSLMYCAPFIAMTRRESNSFFRNTWPLWTIISLHSSIVLSSNFPSVMKRENSSLPDTTAVIG